MLLSPDETKVFLVGFMGSGKTTLGRALAERLGWRFHDIDDVAELTEGRSILRIFAEDGEAYFRRLERETLVRLCETQGRAVIACGGGTFIATENQSLMRERGISIWLDRPFDDIWKRRDELALHRPLFRGEADFRLLYSERLASYQRADVRLAVADGAIVTAVEDLVRILRAEIALA